MEGGTTTTFTYDRADTAINQNAGAGLFVYDRYGNLTQAPDAANAYTTDAYDEANRLTTMTPPGANPAATFTVDPLDRHATRVVSGVTDTYGYLGPTETTFETSATGTRSLLDVDGSRLAVKNGTSVAWLIFDLHGSVAALCPAGGTTISDAYRYDGWGQTIASSGTSANPWKYRGLLGIAPGSIADQLYDMGARDYAPGLGTFTQFDSVQGSAANPLSMNRFLYALANPATLIDPDGHRPMAPCDRDCGSGYDSRPDTELWHKNQQTERARRQKEQARQTRIANTRQATGCRRAGDCGGADALFTGYAPWELDADPMFSNIRADAGLACVNQDYESAECQFSRDVQGWIDENNSLYCTFHRAECDAHDRGSAHTVLGGLGMIPVVGIVFNGADAALYISEGYGGGALIAIGSSVPLAGPLARLGRVASAARAGASDVVPMLKPGIMFGEKVTAQMPGRGWTERLVQSIVDKPVRTVRTGDWRYLPDGGRLNDTATAFYSRRGGYVVINDRTGDLVQVSNRLNPSWVAPWD